MARKQHAFAALILAAITLAAPPCSAQQPASRPVDLPTQKLQAEVDKLREEVTTLRNTNATSRALPWLQAVGMGTLLGGLLVWFAGLGLSRVQKDKLRQDIDISRSEHNLKLFEALGSAEPRIRVGAVSELAQRARESNGQERQTILRVLIGVTKHEDREELQKHIADSIVDVLAAGRSNLDRSPLADFDFQGARLTNAWWRGVDARGADFYNAQLTRAGLAESRLDGVVFKNSDLSGATLRHASARGANFEGANMSGVKAEGIDLEGANLKRAILADADLRNALVARADFSGANLQRAKIQGVDLSSAIMTNADLTGIETDTGTKLP